ncbi:MAG: diacylglycerol kinase family protein [Bacteroidetes bacterium]|nr:diacylglycerol kinase family protein [Bacteroidota bacterium]
MKPSFFKSVSFAINGLKLAWHEKHFKIHLVAALLCITFGFLLKINSTEWFVILICIGAVLALEMINTAIEHLVDLVEPNYNPKAGAIKDLAAGAVLVFSIISALIGIMIFGKYILALLLAN